MVLLHQQQRRRRFCDTHIVFTVQGASTFDPFLVLSGGAPTPTWDFVDDPGIGVLTGAAISQAVGAGTHRVVLGPLALYPYINQMIMDNDALIYQLPEQIFNCTNLTHIYLYTNQLTGAIPETIGTLTNLNVLALYENQLTGVIPPEIGTLTNLVNISMFTNQLTGSIPAEIGALTNLVVLYLFNNQLTGIEDGALGGLAAIHTILLYSNGMTQAAVDVIVADIWGARASYTYATPALNIGGTNANPSGNYVAPPGGGASDSDWNWNGLTYDPLTGLAMVYDLVNDVNTEGFNKWAVTY